MTTEVTGLVCPECKCFVYSRAHHDFRSCSCGAVSVDGGFDYFRASMAEGVNPEVVKRDVSATRGELYRDWNTGADKFGLVPPDAEQR